MDNHPEHTNPLYEALRQGQTIEKIALKKRILYHFEMQRVEDIQMHTDVVDSIKTKALGFCDGAMVSFYLFEVIEFKI